MKRIICLLMATVLLFALFTGCGNVTENKENKFSVVTTISFIQS